MKTTERKLREEAKQLQRIAEKAKKRLVNAPEGKLRIAKKRGKPEYYYRSGASDTSKGQNISKGQSTSTSQSTSNTQEFPVKKSNNERYMKKSEKQFAAALAQRDYDQKVVKRAEERIRAIDTFLEKYERTSLGSLYETTNPCRRELIQADVISDTEYIRRWQEVEYKGKSFENSANEIVTERGERVRSKSEKIIADKLFALGIPYRYEYPLVLEPNIVIYPDFTVLRMPEREEVFWEHFGKMDDMDYVEKVIYKLATYERNGIYPGDRLFMTFETGKKSINTRNLNHFIKTVFWAQ